MIWKEEAEHQAGLRKDRTNVSPCETEYHRSPENPIRYLSARHHTGNRLLLPSSLRYMVYKEKGRVRRWYCHHPGSSERHRYGSTHAAQASQTPLAERGASPIVTHLHDPGLGLTHVVVGGRTSNLRRWRGCCCRHLLCPLSRLVRCSRDERPDGSLPAFAWGDVPR